MLPCSHQSSDQQKQTHSELGFCRVNLDRLGSLDPAEQSWKRAVHKVQAAGAMHGGRLEELDEGDDEGPPPVLQMEFTVADMGLHFVEVDQTPLEDDRVRAAGTACNNKYCNMKSASLYLSDLPKHATGSLRTPSPAVMICCERRSFS